MKMKFVIMMLLVVLLSVGFAQAQEPVTIRFASFQSGAVVEKWAEQFAEFEAETGIHVEHEYVPSGESVQQYMTMAAGNQLPDVVMASAIWHRALAARGLFAPLTQEEFPNLDFADLWPTLLANYTYDGQIYGLPTDMDIQLVFYNKALFDAAGVDYPEPDWTWDDFADTAEQLSSGDGAGRIYGSANISPLLLSQMAWAYGGDVFDPETNVATLDTDGGRTAMELYNRLLVTDRSMPIADMEGVGMDTGRAAMGIYGPWAAWYIFRESDIDWDVVPSPRGTEDAILAWGSSLAIFNTSEHKEEAARLIEFMLSPENQYQRAADFAWFPPGQPATEMAGFMDEAVLGLNADQKQYILDSIPFGRAPFIHANQAELDAAMSQEISLLAAGSEDVEQAIANVTQRWNEILAQ